MHHNAMAVKTQSFMSHSSAIDGSGPVAQGGTRQSENQAAQQVTNLSVNPSTQQIILVWQIDLLWVYPIQQLLHTWKLHKSKPSAHTSAWHVQPEIADVECRQYQEGKDKGTGVRWAKHKVSRWDLVNHNLQRRDTHPAVLWVPSLSTPKQL